MYTGAKLKTRKNTKGPYRFDVTDFHGMSLIKRFICGLFLSLLLSRVGFAAPSTATRIGGLNFSSPVEGMVTSIYWNPAALGLATGTRVFLDGTLRLTHLQAERQPIDPSTGTPYSGPGALSFEKEKYHSMAPDLFFGLSTNLGSDSVVLGVAVYTPYAELDRFAGGTLPGSDGSLRYHKVSMDWFNIYVSPVVSVKLHRRFYVGVGLSYVRSVLNMSFYRDRTIRETYKPGNEDDYRVEDPYRSEMVDLSATDNSLTFSGGAVLILPQNIRLGVAYRSKALGLERSNVEASGRVSVSRYDESAPGWVDIKGRAKVYYVLPDSLSIGAAWNPDEKWDLNLHFEWVHFSVHSDILFKFSGNEFRAENMGNWDLNFHHYRGFNDVWRVQLGGAYKPWKGLRMGGGLMYESALVDKKWVNAAAVDNHKLDLLLTIEWYPHKNVSLHFGYAISFMGRVAGGGSGFDPTRTTSCVTNRVDIVWNEDCNYVDSGKGLPSAAGDYWKLVHRIGFGIGYHYY